MSDALGIPLPAGKQRDYGYKDSALSHGSPHKVKQKVLPYLALRRILRTPFPQVLYLVAAEGGLLKDSLELVKVPSSAGRVRYTIKPVEEKLSFDKGFYVFIRAVQLLVSQNNGIVVVGLAGPSGSGKSVFSEKVGNFIPGAALISMDMYNDASRLIDSNFDDPRLTDYDLLLENLQDLKEGKATKIPMYSFKESKRVGYRVQEPPKSRLVMLEGIYALSQRIRPLLDLRVSITGGVHFDLVKRVLRDIDRSGQAPEEIIQQISDTVYPMYKAYIEPDLKTAHLRVYNTFNPFSGFMNATYILKSDKPVSKEAIKACLKADHMYKRESEMYDIYLLPPGEDPETCQSWLRMRNRDGRYDLRFEEWVTEGDFVISPRISFEVNVRILGGLMALGYEIGTIMKRTSTSYSDEKISIKLDDIEGVDRTFVQVQGKARDLVGRTGKQLGLEGTYIPRSYIEQIQLEKLSASFSDMPEDLRQHFPGDSMLGESPIGRSPTLQPAFRRTTGFFLPERPSMASSAPVGVTKMTRSNSNASQVNGLISHAMRLTSDTSSRPPSAHHSELDLRSRASRSSRESSGEIDFAFEGAEHQAICRPAGNSNHVINERVDSAIRGRRSASLTNIERLMRCMNERLEKLTQRPQDQSSKIDFQIQALTEQQQNLNKQIQELVQTVEGIAAAASALSTAKPLPWASWTPALLCAGGALALMTALRTR